MKKNISQKNPAVNNFIFFLLLFCCIILCNNASAQSGKWVAPEQANTLKNPVAGNTEVLANAQALYKTYCTPCHGAKGKGDGQAAVGLAKKPADHTSDYVQSQTDGALFWMITEGHNPMPSYKTTITEDQRWALVNYIRTLAKTAKK